jgi:hypothetical protein
MGVLQRSPVCIAVFNQNQFLLNDFQHALPDFRPDDNVGSVFSDQRYLACAVVPGGPTTRASRILAPWCWEQGEDRPIVVVNLTGALAQARVHLPWSDLQANAWRLRDCLSDAVHARDSVEMSQQGLYGGPRTLEVASIPVLPRGRCRGGLGRPHVTSPGRMAEPECGK